MVGGAGEGKRSQGGKGGWEGRWQQQERDGVAGGGKVKSQARETQPAGWEEATGKSGKLGGGLMGSGWRWEDRGNQGGLVGSGQLGQCGQHGCKAQMRGPAGMAGTGRSDGNRQQKEKLEGSDRL